MKGLDDPGRTEQVDLDRTVERGVEAHGGGRVDDDVAVGQGRPALIIETEAVGGHVALDHRDPFVDRGPELVFAQLRDQAVEGIVAEDLPPGPLRRCGSPSRPNQQDQPAVGGAAKQPFDQCRAEEAGRSGDGDSFAR